MEKPYFFYLPAADQVTPFSSYYLLFIFRLFHTRKTHNGRRLRGSVKIRFTILHGSPSKEVIGDIYLYLNK